MGMSKNINQSIYPSIYIVYTKLLYIFTLLKHIFITHMHFTCINSHFQFEVINVSCCSGFEYKYSCLSMKFSPRNYMWGKGYIYFINLYILDNFMN